MSKPQVVSTRWTLFLKLILPTLWTCFFGGMALAMLFVELQVNEPFSPLTARLMMFSFAVSTVGLLYLLFMRVKWVAMDAEHFYISNFFKSYKYTYDSVAAIEETKILWWRRITIHFHQPSAFGKSVFFIASYYWTYFLEKNPAVLAQLVESTTQAAQTQQAR